MLEIRYVWEWPVRLTHWVNMISIVVLSITGYYIGHPFYTASDSAQYVMGWNRAVHFSFAYLFTVSVVARLVWAFIGNHHCSWAAFFPLLTRKGRANAWQMFRYYSFTGRKISYEVGHNALAATAYSGVMILFLLQIATGFTLYGQFSPGGFWAGATGFIVGLVDLQYLRLIHHMIMWLLIGFAIHHVYSAWLMDVKERNGTMSSIFGGHKFVEPEDL